MILDLIASGMNPQLARAVQNLINENCKCVFFVNLFLTMAMLWMYHQMFGRRNDH